MYQFESQLSDSILGPSVTIAKIQVKQNGVFFDSSGIHLMYRYELTVNRANVNTKPLHCKVFP